MKGLGKPTDFMRKGQGILDFFATAIFSGKGINSVDAESYMGRKLSSAKGSIFVADAPIYLQQALRAKQELPKPGCGVREVARRLKQIQRKQIQESLQGN